MKIQIGSSVWRGRGIDLRTTDVGAQRLTTAIVGDEPVDGLVVQCPRPCQLGHMLLQIHSRGSFSTTEILALAARSRDHRAPQDDELATIDRELAQSPPPSVDTTSIRRQIAALNDEICQVRERVTRLQGAVKAMQSDGDRPADMQTTLRRTVQTLSDLETERAAARQELASARETNRRRRDDQEKRLRLADRAANLRRDARQYLAAQIRPEFSNALQSVPDDAPTPVRTVLAVAHISALEGPIVLESEVFDSLRTAVTFCATPVIQL